MKSQKRDNLLNRMRDEEVFPARSYADRLEQLGKITDFESRR